LTAQPPSHEVIPVRAKRRTRRYDQERGCYVYDISFTTRAPITDRTAEVARAFGLGVDGREHVLYRDFELRLAEGDVAYVTGDSGSGKSALLRALKADLGQEAADIDDLEVDEEVPIVDTVGASFSEALSLLSRVGLNDAFLFLRKYAELSDGQRYRYRIAQMVDEGKPFWLADEFCSTLDRTTARIVAYNMGRLARRSGATLVVATTHTDLEGDLAPSVYVRKGWGEEIEVEYRSSVEAPHCTIAEGVSIREGTRDDYRRLAYLHYRDSGFPVPRQIYAMERQGEVIGVIVYSYPPVRVAGRRTAVGEFTGLLDLLGALFRLFGLDQSAMMPALALIIVFFLIAVPVGLLAQSRKVRAGREGMLGEVGRAVTDLDPDGRVFVHSEYWNATADETIPAGTNIVVVSVDRMTLRVRRSS